MIFGISLKNKKILENIFKQHLKNATVIIYGSRVKNTYTNISDVDLVIKNSTINRHQLANLIDDIDESDFPHLCDIQIFEDINNLKLKQHINRLGAIFYTNI